MVGGDKTTLDRIRPWMEPMGKKIYYCGAAGMGLHAKLTQNLILSNILQGFNEGMVLATKAGVDPKLMGIGPVPATQKLLTRFGSLAKIREASLEELQGVVNRSQADSVWQHFHRKGEESQEAQQTQE